MATYCTTTDTKKWNPKRNYTTTTQPTLSQLTSYVQDATNEMDFRMEAVHISTPVSTSPATYISRELGRLCSIRAAALAESSAFMMGHKQDSGHAAALNEMYEEGMKRIEAKPWLVEAGAGAVADSYEYSNPDEARDADDEPFARDKEF